MKDKLSKILYFYLNDPVSLAASSAFTCGLVAFVAGVCVMGLFTTDRPLLLGVGIGLGMAGGVAGALEQLRASRKTSDSDGQPARPERGRQDRVLRCFALFAGAAMLCVSAGSLLGLSGTLLVLLGLISGALVSTMLALVLDRD